MNVRPPSASALNVDSEGTRWRPTDRFLDNGTPGHAAYVNGVPLFVYESPLSTPARPFFNCVVYGHMTTGAGTQAAAQQAGMAQAIDGGVTGADRRMTRDRFEALFDPAVPPSLAPARRKPRGP